MKKISKILLVVMTILSLSTNMINKVNAKDTKHYFSNTVNTGKDNGYSDSDKIESDDPHFGWKLGEFSVSGYTRETEEKGKSVFLKTGKDKIKLSFELKQNINKLNKKDYLSICNDRNGYDEHFNIEKSDFGKGTLIIKHVDYQNKSKDPVVYRNYLQGKAKKGKKLDVQFLEEGDYEVSLDYEIKSDSHNLLGVSILPNYHNYKIYFKFSIRNGNCMVFPKEVGTNKELANNTMTKNGFYLDLAKSRYLNIDITRKIYQNKELTDVRFNRPATDGEQFTEEGLYIITVKNKYTKENVKKQIYVGENDVIKAHFYTGKSINQINQYLSNGATINSNGSIKLKNNKTIKKKSTNNSSNNIITYVVAIGLVVAVVALYCFYRFKNKSKKEVN